MNQFRTVYDKLESKVSDNTEDLSVNEYNIILSNKLDSVTLIKFLTGFRNKNLDPTQILTLSIPLCTTGEHLLIIAWCIRYGANITTGNLFKESEGDHILMYIYKLGAILEITIKNTLILMLRLSGSIFQGSIPEGNEKDYLLLTEPLDNILKNIETKSLQKI